MMSKLILAVDDNVMMLEVYLHVLGAEGYRVAAATGGGQALRQLEESMAPPDLILLDLGLPDMSGWEFLRSVRERVEWRDIPVVVVSAFVEPPGEQAGSYPEYQRYLSKMETAQELVGIVQEVIGEPGPPEVEQVRFQEEGEDEDTWEMAA